LKQAHCLNAHYVLEASVADAPSSAIAKSSVLIDACSISAWMKSFSLWVWLIEARGLGYTDVPGHNLLLRCSKYLWNNPEQIVLL
jgi:hypothetical protein